ncbi:MAG: NAD-dependent epimerase/dehydratase family protein [Nitrospinales bacterium]
MKVLITGGTGFIGSVLIRRLLERRMTVEALVRHPGQANALESRGVKVLRADLSRPETLKEVEGTWDVVINTAGVMGKFGISPEQIRAVNVDGVAALYRLCRERGARQFIHLSTVGVTGPTQGAVFDESSPCHPSTVYERCKLEGEQVLAGLHEPGAGSLSILRPGFTYGPGDRHKLALFRAIDRGFFFLIGPGDGLLQPIYVDDLVKGIEKTMDARPEGCEIINLCGARPLTWKTFATTAAAVMGKKIPPVNLPLWLCRTAAGVFETAGKFLPFAPPLTRSRIALMTQSYAYRIDKAERLLGFKPETSLEEGIARTVNEYRERRLL